MGPVGQRCGAATPVDDTLVALITAREAAFPVQADPGVTLV